MGCRLWGVGRKLTALQRHRAVQPNSTVWDHRQPQPIACSLPSIWTIIKVFITYRLFFAIHLNHLAVFLTYRMFVAIHLNHHRSLHHLPHVCCHPSKPSSQSSSPTTCLLPFNWTIIAVFITYHMFVAIHLNHHRSLHHLPHVCCHSSEPSSQSSSPSHTHSIRMHLVLLQRNSVVEHVVSAAENKSKFYWDAKRNVLVMTP